MGLAACASICAVVADAAFLLLRLDLRGPGGQRVQAGPAQPPWLVRPADGFARPDVSEGRKWLPNHLIQTRYGGEVKGREVAHERTQALRSP